MAFAKKSGKIRYPAPAFGEWLEIPNFARHFGSHQRPGAVLRWIESLEADHPEDIVGPVFWQVVRDNWATFDLIPHTEYAEAFDQYLTYCPDDPVLVDAGNTDRTWFDSLPDEFAAYRGQCAARDVGLAWTVDRERAEWFARTGYRGRGNAHPILLTTTIRKRDIVLASNTRNESEVVPYVVPNAELTRGWKKAAVYTGESS